MDHELAQEQAALALAIQDARREMQKLKEEKETFLQEREAEALLRITQVLQEAKDVLDATKEYRNAYEKLRSDAQEIAAAIKDALMLFRESRDAFIKETDETRMYFEKESQSLKVTADGIKAAQRELEATRETIRMDRLVLEKEQRKVTDDRQKLKGAIEMFRKQKRL